MCLNVSFELNQACTKYVIFVHLPLVVFNRLQVLFVIRLPRYELGRLDAADLTKPH